MEAVVGLLVMILGVSYGVDTHCDGRQDGAQCYGALGGTVAIQLMDNASEMNMYQWFNESTIILDGRGGIVLSKLKETRFFFTPSNGTFKINKLNRADGGEYKLDTFDINGQKSEKKLQLTIQAPVSSVLLVPECLSQGEMKVSCSSEGGDSLQYSWTLNGHTLTDAELLSGNTETNSITLKQHVSGQLVCSVRNNVSRMSTRGNNSQCESTTPSTTITVTEASTEADHSLLICGVRAAVVILALIGITVYFACKKKKYRMAKGSAIDRQVERQQNSVVMVEMGSCASEL